MEDSSVKLVRNICILAHVDHGKTTLADHLIAAAGGGVLHAKQAGKLRYLDYTDDEQQRAITMKSSSIALRFQNHVINLIDSPGHIDFCSEVSTAVRLSDGALVLVDVCEGVHIQTHAVLRQAWAERVRPCLVLNKIDRLITELKFTPMEAYTRMQAIIADVNIIIGSFRSEKYLSDVDSVLAGPADLAGGDQEQADEEDEEDAFGPQKGTVAFASAGDGWAFRIDQFAHLYAAKLGASVVALRKALWGEYFYNPKTKKIVGKKGAAGKLKPMFVQFILEPLWQAYDAIMQGKEGNEMLNKIINSMNLSVPPKDLQHRDTKVVLQAVMSSWLPLATNILSMVIEVLPDPAAAQPERIDALLLKRKYECQVDKTVEDEVERVRKSVETCDDRNEAPCIVFVSKMFAVPIEMVPKHGPNGELLNLADELNVGDTDAARQECFMAFARVFSGVLHTGQKLFVLSSVYNPFEGDKRTILEAANVDALYMMMGRGLNPVSTVSAGNLVAIRGLGMYILKSATLSSTPYSWPFGSMFFQAAPIVRVAIEPSDPSDMGALAKGLRLLNRADPFVEVSLSGTGEHVIAAAGEVHLERCVKDLRERFARVKLEVSPPLVAFRETIEFDGLGGFEGPGTEQKTLNGRCTIHVRVVRMPTALIRSLDDSSDLLREILEGKLSAQRKNHGRGSSVEDADPMTTLKSRLYSAIQQVEAIESQGEENARGQVWERRLQKIWSLGPRHVGPNILLLPDAESSVPDTAKIKGSAHVSEKLGLSTSKRNGVQIGCCVKEVTSSSLAAEAESLDSSIVSGFQLATAAGPLCEEPMWGLAFLIDAFVHPPTPRSENVVLESNGETSQLTDQYGPFSGQVITAVREACRSAVLSRKPRIVEAMYFCELSTSSQFLGQMYGVLGRRRARILKEEMREGTALFTVHAFMPVAESFGFADELRRKTSGAASAQLMLSHWEPISQDPFFVPQTEEELEEYGDGSSILQNTARKLIDAVRRRKGLPVEEKVVEHATKQRTRARKV